MRGRSARTRVSPCRCGIGQGFASRATGAGGGGSFVVVEWSGAPDMPDRILRVNYCSVWRTGGTPSMLPIVADGVAPCVAPAADDDAGLGAVAEA